MKSKISAGGMLKKRSIILFFVVVMLSGLTSCDNREHDLFSIQETTHGRYCYTVFGDDGTVLFSRVSVSLPSIEQVSEDVLEIRFGVGTGTWLAEYFNLESRVLSSQYECAYYLQNNTVAYFIRAEDHKISICIQDPFTLETKVKDCPIDIVSANISDGIKDVVWADDGVDIVFYEGADDYSETTIHVDFAGDAGDGSV